MKDWGVRWAMGDRAVSGESRVEENYVGVLVNSTVAYGRVGRSNVRKNRLCMLRFK